MNWIKQNGSLFLLFADMHLLDLFIVKKEIAVDFKSQNIMETGPELWNLKRLISQLLWSEIVKEKDMITEYFILMQEIWPYT